ncbi:DUF86 domain-containing protein [Methanoregula sp.]|uniref:HepT-like ribonuclease domain-containing protein n=1 Tax=Methanoregula sp. TaxID=2052170 RepID=UPI003BAFA1CD
MHRSYLHFLDDIREATGKIRDYTEGMTYHEFLKDQKTQDAVIRNFEIIGEATKNLPDDLKERYPAIAWKQVAGFRDIIAHGYFRIDFEVLWGIVTERLPEFKKEIAKVLREETKREKEVRK